MISKTIEASEVPLCVAWTRRGRRWLAAGIGCLPLGLLPTAASALELSLSSRQTGGIFADGGLNNSLGFQNYFVGYGTTPGLPRTAERRSFFIFDLISVPADHWVVAAKLELRLPFGGLIFGKDAGDPLLGSVPSDTMESFQVGLVDLPSAIVLGPLETGPAVTLFGVMASLPVAMPTLFISGSMLPSPGDGGPPIVPIELDVAGMSALNAKRGGEVVLSGWMPSWSPDLRPDPSPPPLYFEASELIFGLSDVHAMAILTPKLVLTLSPVPEPPSTGLWLFGLAALLVRRGQARARCSAAVASQH